MQQKRDRWKRWASGAVFAAAILGCLLTGLGLTGRPASAVSAPTFASLSPATGSYVGGNTVVITGTNFASTPTVTFAGIPSPTVTFVSATTVQAVVPTYSNLSNRVSVALTNPDGGTITYAGSYYYNAAYMSVTSASPRFGPAGATSFTTLTGSGFYTRYTTTLAVFNPDSATQTNMQTSYVLDTASLIAAGKMRSDCADIRLRASDTQTLAPHWVESGTCNTASTRVWFKALGSIASGTNLFFYLTYGQLSATSVEAPQSVFEFFEDFSSADTAKWNYPSSWSTSGGKAIATDGQALTTNAAINFAPTSATRGYALDVVATNTGATAPYNVNIRVNTPAGLQPAPVTSTTGSGAAFFDSACAASCALTTRSPHKYTTNMYTNAQTLFFDGTSNTTAYMLAATSLSGLNLSFAGAGNVETVAIRKVATVPLVANFNNATITKPVVSFGPANADPNQVVVTSDTTMNVQAPNQAAQKVDVKVSYSDEMPSTASGAFAYVAAPTVTATSPNSGTIAGGDTVTLTGTNFSSGMVVNIGGVPATNVTVLSATSATAIVPAHPYGPASVVVTTNLSGTLNNGYTYTTPAPVINSVSPNSGPASGGTSTTVTVDNLATNWIARPLTVTNNTGTATPANKQVPFALDTATLIAAGKMRSDCADLRVYDADKVTVTLFGIVYGCNTANTNIWAQAGVVGANDTKTLYVAYGNLQAGNSLASGVYDPAGKGGLTITSGTLQPTIATPYAMATYGKYIFVGGTTGWRIYDTSTSPLNPVQVAAVNSGTDVRAFAFRYPTVFVGTGTSLDAYNISTMTSPVKVGTTTTGISTAFGLAVSGNNVFVANYGNSTITAYAAYDPANLVHSGTLNTSGFNPNPTGIAAFGSYAVLTSYTGYPQLINIASMATMSYVTSIYNMTGGANGTSVNGKLFYFTASSNQYLVTMSIVPVSPYGIPLSNTVSWAAGGASGLYTSGTYAYGAGAMTGGMQVLNIANPYASVSMGTAASSTLVGSVITGIGNQYVYVAGPAGLTGFRMSQSTELGDETVISNTSALEVRFGGIAGTALTQSGSALSVKTPARPVGPAAVTVTRGDGQTVSLANAFTYVAGPTLNSITPGSGGNTGGNTVTLTGTGFVEGAQVKFGQGSYQAATVLNSSTLTVTTPANPTSIQDVTVKNPDDQTVTLSPGFKFTDLLPLVSAITPAFGPAKGGTSLSATATNLSTGWTARALKVTNTTASALSSYHVSFTMDTATMITQGKMRSDCADLRVFDTNKTTVLPYGIADGCNTPYTQVWAQVGTVAASSNKTVYVAYGNASVSTSGANGTSVPGNGPQNATNVQASGMTPTQVNATESYGNYVFAATNNGMLVYDVSTPASPIAVQLLGTGAVVSLAVKYPYLYVANSDMGIITSYNISDPANPVQEARVTVTTQLTTITTAGNYLYAGYGQASSSSINTYDISSPSAITLVKNTALGSSSVPTKLLASGSTLYMTISGSTGVVVYSLAAPANPVAGASASPGGAIVNDFAVQGKNLFIVAGTVLYAYDVPSAASVTLKGSVAVPANSNTVKISGSYAQVGVGASGTAGSVNRFDIANPATMVQVGSLAATRGGQTSTFNGNKSTIVFNGAGYGNYFVANWNVPVELAVTEEYFQQLFAPTALALGGATATGFSYNSTTGAVTATSAARTPAGLVDATLTRSDGVAGSTPNAYTYVPPPGPLSITPGSGLKTGGDVVTINGTGFTSGATVKVGAGSYVTPSSVTATSIVFTVPAGATGRNDIIVKNGDGQISTLSPGYQYRDIPLTVSAVTPDHGSSAGGTATTMTLSGTTSGWTSQPLSITNTSVSAKANQQVSFTMDTASLIAAGKMRSDCADLRVFATDQTTVLPYGIGGGCNTAATTMWAEVPNVPANSTVIIYPSYNNPEATVSAANGTLSTSTKGQVSTYQFTGPNPGVVSTGIDTNGSYVYAVTSGNNLVTYQVPVSYTQPSVTSTLPLGAQSRAVAVLGSYVYTLATGNLRVFDIATTPSTPVQLSSTAANVPTTATQMVAYNGYLYITDTAASTLTVFDATNPAAPTFVRTMTVTNVDRPMVRDGYLYVLNSGTGLPSIYSLALPGTPTLTKVVASGYLVAYDVQGTYLYGMQSGTGNLVVYDISNKATPVLVSTTATYYGASLPSSIRVSGGYAYLGWSTTATTGQIFMYNIVNPAAPVLATPAPITNQVMPTNILPAIGGGRILFSNSSNQSIVTGNYPQVYGMLAAEMTFSHTTTPTITYGGTAGTGVNVAGSVLNATTPAHASGQVSVVVTRDDGATATTSNAYTFDYPPQINNLTPSSGSYVGGDTVTITGDYFTSGTQIKFGYTGSFFTPTFVNSTTLRATMPAGQVGQIDILVKNPDGQTGSLTDGYTYRGIPPTLTSISPSSGTAAGSSAVTLTGTNFFAGGIYRTKLILANSNSTTLNDTTVPVIFDTTELIAQGKMQSDGSDIRFYNTDGQSSLPFWVEPATINTDTTKAWVRLPSIQPGQRTIYLSYGNNTLTNASSQSDAFKATISGGLLGWWKLDEPSTGAVADSSQSSPLSPGSDVNTTVASGMYGNGRQMNGTSSYIVIPSTSTMKTATGGISFETWFATADNTKGQYIMSTHSSSNGTQMGMNINMGGINCLTTGLFCFGVRISGSLKMTSFPASSVPTGVLNHVVGSYNGSTISLYLNGHLMSSANFTGVIASNYPLCLGMQSNTTANTCSPNSNGFSGIMDESRMYNRGLTEAEADALYRNRAFTMASAPNTLFAGSAVLDGTVTNTTAEELSYVPKVTFDGQPAIVLNVASATSMQVATPVHAAGKVDVTFTSIEGQASTLTQAYTYVAAPGPTLTSVSPNAGPTAGGVTTTLSGTGFYDKGTYRQPVTITNNDATIKTGYQVPITINSAVLIAAGKMQADGRDIRVTDTDGGTSLAYYIQSATLNTANTVVWVKVPYISPGNKQIFINYGNSSAAAESSAGTTFSRSISGLQASYTLDNDAPYDDFSGNELSLNEPAGGQNSTVVPGRFGQARQFNGTGTSYLRAPGSTALNATANSMSAETWFRLGDLLSANQTIVSTMSASGSTGYQLTLNTTLAGSGWCTTANYLCFSFYSSSGLRSVGVQSSTLKTGLWYHMVGTYDGSTAKMYLNGALVSSFAYTGTIPAVSGPICLGGSPQSGSSTICSLRSYKGTIDETRLYNRSLTASDVSDLYLNNVAQGAQPNTAMVRKRIGSTVQLTGDESPYGTTTRFGTSVMNVAGTTATTLIGPSPAHDYGRTDVSVTNPDGQSATLADSYRYAAYRYRVISAPNSLRQEEPAAITVQAEDQMGNPITVTDSVTLALSTSTNTGFFARSLTPGAGQWDFNTVVLPAGSSQATFYYKNTAKGPATVTVKGPIADGSIDATVSFDVGSKYSLLVTGVSNPIKAGVPSSVTVQAVDYKGQALEEYQGTIGFSSGDIQATLPADYTLTSQQHGGRTFINGVTFTSEGTWCITVVDRSDTDITGQQCGITVSAANSGTISKLKYISAPQTIAAGTSSGAITVQTQDSGNSAIPVRNADKLIYLYASGGNSDSAEYSTDGSDWSDTMPRTLTIKRNTSSAVFYYRNVSQGTATLTIRDDQGTGTDFGWRNAVQQIAVGVGGPARIGFTIPDVPLLAGDTHTMHVAIQDMVGNDLAIASDQVVYLTTGSTTARMGATADVSAATDTLQVTIPAGQTGVDFYYTDTASGLRPIAASDAAPADGAAGWIDDTLQVDIAAGPAVGTAFITPARSVVAGAISEVVTFQLKDQYDNPAPAAEDITVDLRSASADTLFYPETGDDAITSLIIPAGETTASFKFKQMTYLPTVALTAGVSGLSDGSQTELIDRGAVNKISADTAEATATAGVASGAISITLRNQFDVLVAPQEATELYVRSPSPTGQFSSQASPWTPITSVTLSNATTETPIYYKDTRAGAIQLVISDQTDTADVNLEDASLDFTVTAGVAMQLQFSSAAQRLLAGQPSTEASVALADQYGNNVIAAQEQTVIITSTGAHMRFDATADGDFTATSQTLTLAAGTDHAPFFFKDSIAETVVLTAATAGYDDAAQTEVISWGEPNSLRITGPTQVDAGMVTQQIQIVSQNIYGVAVPMSRDELVRVESNSSTGRFDTSSTGTFDGSVGYVLLRQNDTITDVYYKNTAAGTDTLTAVLDTAPDARGTLAIDVMPGPAVGLAVTTQPNTLELNEFGTVRIAQVDSYGNETAVTSPTPRRINLATTSARGLFKIAGQTISEAAIQPGESGVSLSYVDTAIGLPTLTFSTAGLTAASQQQDISYGDSTGMVLTTDDTALEAGTASGQVTLAPVNSYGAVVPASDTFTAALTSSMPTGTFSTDRAGTQQISELPVDQGSTGTPLYYTDTTGGEVTITASSPVYEPATLTFNVSGATPTVLRFSTPELTTVAGQESAVITIGLRDIYGNVTTANADTPISLASSAGTAQLSSLTTAGAGNPLTATILIGAGDSSFKLTDTKAGSSTLTADSDTLQSASQQTAIVAAPLDHMNSVSDVQTIQTHRVSRAITFKGYDVYQNETIIAPDAARDLALASTSPDGSFSASADPFAVITGMTVLQGATEATVYYQDGSVGDFILTLAAADGSLPPATQQIHVVPGPVARLQFATEDQVIVKDTPSHPVTVQLADQYGFKNSTDHDVSTTITSSSPTGQYSLDGRSGWTAEQQLVFASGQTDQTVYYRDSQTGTFNMEAAAAGLTSGSQSIQVIPGEIAQLAVAGETTATAGIPMPVHVETQTSTGLSAAVDKDTVIPMSSGSAGQFSLTESPFDAIDSITIEKGQYAQDLFYRNTATGDDTITASSPDGSDWNAGTFTVAVGAGSFVAYGVVPGEAFEAGGYTTMTLEARDQYGNQTRPATDQTAYLYTPHGTFASSPDGPWDVTDVTIPASTGITQVYYSATLPGIQTVTLCDHKYDLNPDIDIRNGSAQVVVASGPATQMRFTTEPRTISAGSVSGDITVQLVQADGTPAYAKQNTTVKIKSTTTTGYFNGLSFGDLVFAPGQSTATFQYRSSSAGADSIVASKVGLETIAQEITVTALVPSRVSFLSARQIKNAGVESDQLHVQLQDRYGNPSASDRDVTVNLKSSSPTMVFGADSGTAESQPITSMDMPAGSTDMYYYAYDTVLGDWIIQATPLLVSGLEEAAQAYFVRSGAATKLLFVPTTVNAEVGQSVGMRVQLSDTFGNAVTAASDVHIFIDTSSSDYRLNLPGAGSGGRAANESVIDKGDSYQSFSYIDYQVGSQTLTAKDIQSDTDSDDQGLANTALEATIHTGVPSRLEMSGTTTARVGEAAKVQVKLFNRFNVETPLTEDTVLRPAISDSAMRFAEDSAMNDSFTEKLLPAGTSSFEYWYRTTTAGTPTLLSRMIQPTDSTVVIENGSLKLHILTGDIAKLSFVTSTPTRQAGQPSVQQTIQTQDIYGNPVPVVGDLTVYLSSTDPRTVLASDATLEADISTVTIRDGTSSAGFYFKHLTPGLQAITASDAAADDPDQGLVNDTLDTEVSLGSATQLVWLDVPPSAESGEVVLLRVQSQNRYGVPVAVTSPRELQFFTVLNGSSYALTSAGPWNASRTQVPADTLETTIYYRGITEGTDVIRVADRASFGALDDDSAAITVGPGIPAQIALTTEPYAVDARHTSPVMTAEVRNKYGGPSPVLQDTNLYLRSDSTGSEFTGDPTGNWGVNYLTLPQGQSSLDFYYHDSEAGTPTITVSDNLPLNPDVDLANATQQEIIESQTMDHFEVSNISTPQIQGTPSSVVVRAEDSDGYGISGYAGTVSFASPTDPSARLPKQYTFNPGTDKGIHTFQNGVTFAHTGFQTVGATDINQGYYGEQVQIEVLGVPDNLAGFKVEMPSDAVAGQPFAAEITAIDANGNVVAEYDGIKTINFKNPTGSPHGDQPDYPEFVTFNNGVASGVMITLFKAETVSLNVSQDTTVSGDSQPITIAPADAASFKADAPPTATAGQAFGVRLEALDVYGNTATGYAGDKAVTFSGAQDSPDGTKPHFPAGMSFDQGIADATVTLFAREVIKLTAIDGQVTGDTGDINVAAADARMISLAAGNGQHALVGQVLPIQPSVQVNDAYGNQKDNVPVTFAVTAGQGTISDQTVTTDTFGQAAASWRIGPDAGPDNNGLEVSLDGAQGSPVAFIATGNNQGFQVAVVDPQAAGVAFSPTITAIYTDGAVITDYSGDKVLTFSGPGIGPTGQAPQYPATLHFENGVAQLPADVTLFAVETTTLTVTENADMLGTSNPFTIHAGPAAKLALTTSPQRLENGQASKVVTVCLQDLFGNTVIADHDWVLDIASSSATGQFSILPDGPWDAKQTPLVTGTSCADFYYRDTTAGTHTLASNAVDIIGTEQAVSIAAVPQPAAPVAPADTPPPAADASAAVPTITVYPSNPTQSTAVPDANNAAPTEIPLPVIDFPTITSPRNGAFLTPIDGTVILYGTAPTSTTIRIRTTQNAIVGATTSDSQGNWQINIPASQFTGETQRVYSELASGNARSRSVGFAIKQPTFWERVITLFTQ